MIGLDRGIFKRCQNVIIFEEGIVLKNFPMGRPRAKQAQNICDTDAQTTNARAPAAFAGFDGDPIEQTGSVSRPGSDYRNTRIRQDNVLHSASS